MSNLCLVNLRENRLNIDEYNKLSRKLIQFALRKNIAFSFNSYDYEPNLVKEVKMKNFFLISDSFIHKNCNLLDTSYFHDVNNEKIFKTQFIKKFSFFKTMLKIIFSYNVSLVEIYVTTDGSINSEEDFNVINSNEKIFVEDLFKSIIDSKNEWAYGFQTVKFKITKN